MKISSLSAIAMLCALSSLSVSCVERKSYDVLADDIAALVSDAPAQIGVAVIVDSRDTVCVNNDTPYRLMSVFKLHQAIAVGHELDRLGVGLDTVLMMNRAELSADTWSPMLKEHPESEISLPLTILLDYLMLQSDNNVSNVLFEQIVGTAKTDSIIRSLGVPADFRIRFTEAEMQEDHSKSDENWSSPLACAALVNRLFTDSLISEVKQEYIKGAMSRCATGANRLPAPLSGIEGVNVAHRTGSGYVNELGEVGAVNDVAYVTLPDGHGYAVAVFVKDYKGDEKDAEALIARISELVYKSVDDNIEK